MLHDAVRIVLVRLDDFACHGGKAVVGEPVLERVVRFLETQAQRIAIERLQAFDLLVVVEAIRLARALEQLVEPDQPMIEKIEPVRTYLGVEDALDREDIVFGGELPLLPLERWIFGEVDPGTDLDREEIGRASCRERVEM